MIKRMDQLSIYHIWRDWIGYIYGHWKRGEIGRT